MTDIRSLKDFDPAEHLDSDEAKAIWEKHGYVVLN